MSGIGHTVIAILQGLSANTSLRKKYEIILLVPIDKKRQVRLLNLDLKIKTVFIPDIILRGLRRYNLLPYMDIFIGKGKYLFPNYWNWPLMFSESFTYVYDVSFLVYPEFTDTKNRKFLSRYLRVWLSRTDKIITISNHAKNEIVKYTEVNPGKIEVIYNGINTTNGKSISRKEVLDIKDKYRVEGDYLLFVGNIEPRKNLLRLVGAYRLLPAKIRAKYSLVIVGSYGWNNDGIKRAIEDSVKEGFRILKIDEFVSDEDVTKLYAGASVLVHPALYEGFGMTPLEAMAAGTPTIVANNSSLPEVMGDASLYVDAMNEQDISDKIVELLEDKKLQNRLVKAGKNRVTEFTWRDTTDKIAALIEGR